AGARHRDPPGRTGRPALARPAAATARRAMVRAAVPRPRPAEPRRGPRRLATAASGPGRWGPRGGATCVEHVAMSGEWREQRRRFLSSPATYHTESGCTVCVRLALSPGTAGHTVTDQPEWHFPRRKAGCGRGIGVGLPGCEDEVVTSTSSAKEPHDVPS